MATTRVANPWNASRRVVFAPRLADRHHLDRPIDNTGTVRKLSITELDDVDAVKWYAVELLESGQAVQPEDVPALDIFDIYSLYLVTSSQEARVSHSLRLGFYSGFGAAQAIAHYLQRYFADARVMRVSSEERTRFLEWQVKARKVVSDAGLHEDIELSAGSQL